MIWRRQSFKLWNKKKTVYRRRITCCAEFPCRPLLPGSRGRRASWWRMRRCWKTSHKYYLFTYKTPQAVAKENWRQQMQGNTIFLAQNLGKFEDACTKNTRNFLFSRAYSVLISACKFYWSRGVSCAHMTVIAVIIYGCIHAPLCHIFFKLKWSC